MEEKRFDTAAWWLYERGIRPDHLTFSQAPFYAAMVVAAFEQAVWAFFALQVLVSFLDGADGVLARRTGSVTRRGHLLDSFFDILGIGVTLWVAAEIYPDESYLSGLVGLHQLLLVLLLVNFLVYVQNEIQGTKSITYTRGPVTLGVVLELYWSGFLLVGVLLPLAIGIMLLFLRVQWRKRLWNWYQFLTAGRRKEYKAMPPGERSHRPGHPAAFEGRRRRERTKDADGEERREASTAKP